MNTILLNCVLYAVCACGARRGLAGGYSAETLTQETARKAAERVGWRVVGGETLCPDCVAKQEAKP
jgi:hypothetical protein